MPSHLANPDLDVQADAVPIELNGSDILFTTDGFTVQPLEFPGGNIGSLAVHGTTNDLAVAGAIPKYLSLNAFFEEGMEIATLKRIIKHWQKLPQRSVSKWSVEIQKFYDAVRVVGSILQLQGSVFAMGIQCR